MPKTMHKRITDPAILVGFLLLFILPFAVVVYQLISEIDVGINVAQNEKLGLEYNYPLRQLLQHVIESRGRELEPPQV